MITNEILTNEIYITLSWIIEMSLLITAFYIYSKQIKEIRELQDKLYFEREMGKRRIRTIRILGANLHKELSKNGTSSEEVNEMINKMLEFEEEEL